MAEEGKNTDVNGDIQIYVSGREYKSRRQSLDL